MTTDDLRLFLFEDAGPATHLAIAGELTGKRVKLSTGDTVEVIEPELRGMSTWNTLALLNVAKEKLTSGRPVFSSSSPTGPVFDPTSAANLFVGRIASRLYESARNDGKSDQERAMNWAATSLLVNVRPLLGNPIFQQSVGGLENVAISDIQVNPTSCRRSGQEYDVQIAFFNTQNTLFGLTVLASTVDVSDVVPVTLGNTRVFNRR